MNKSNKVFSGVDQLPYGDAPERIVPGCMVIEGGAFRGVYGSGVLDCLMEAGINMECTIGVSAGALNGMNYVSGQIGRSGKINLMYRHDKRYVGAEALKDNKGIIGFDFLFEDEPLKEDFNEERFNRPERRFIAVATNVETGQAEYFEKGQCSNIYKAIQASASMPYVSKMVVVDDKPCLDGGCTIHIPFQWALDNGYEKIVVVKSRVETYRREEKAEFGSLLHTMYHNYPAFIETFSDSARRANQECDDIKRLAEAGRIFVIQPSVEMNVGRLEPDMEKLGALYYLGFEDTLKALPNLMNYLNMKKAS